MKLSKIINNKLENYISIESRHQNRIDFRFGIRENGYVDIFQYNKWIDDYIYIISSTSIDKAENTISFIEGLNINCEKLIEN